jgi:dimethylhistidine N-methyltransferase
MNAPTRHAAFARAALAGLTAHPKTMSPKWLYDARGAALFEAITDLPEYYPTRTEIALLRSCAHELVEGVGANAAVIEFGAGSSTKTPILLDALESPALYAPIDISDAYLAQSAAAIRARFPALTVRPVLGDFMRLSALPPEVAAYEGPKLGFFPGSTIGNLDPDAMVAFLRAARALLGEGARFIIGVDTPKPAGVLVPAYDDPQGVTAAFNLNLLRRMNDELGSDFDLDAFEHEARWNEAESRIEMHLVSKRAQWVNVSGVRIAFVKGESIHTESSYKLTPEAFLARANEAGWRADGLWLAHRNLFSIRRLKA